MFGFFNHKKLEDYSLLRTDIHSHLIPGIDDGASSMKESVELISQMKNLGFEKLVITPHVRFGSFDNDTREFENRLQDVRYVLEERNINIKLEVGAEQTIDEGFMRHFNNGELKAFGKNKYLLIEFPFDYKPIDLKETIFKLQGAGYNLILAHPERYLYLHDEPELIKDLHDGNILFQLNILSLTGFYSKYEKRFAEKLIKMDVIDLVGSDLHHQRHLDGLKEALSNKTLAELVESGRLMNNMF